MVALMDTNTKTTATSTPPKKAAARAPAKKAVAPVKKAAPVKPKVGAVPAEVAPKPEKAPRITPSTDPQHQAWQTLKKDLTAVMADLLYDSRRVVPDHSPSREEAGAKVGAALKALTEFTESIRVK